MSGFLLQERSEFGFDPGDAVGCFFISYGFVIIGGGSSGRLVSFIGTIVCKVFYGSTVEAGVACLPFNVCCIALEASSASASASSPSAVPCSGPSYVHGDWLVVHGVWGI